MGKYPNGNAELEFNRLKVFSGLQLERVLITLLSKIICGHVTWFQLKKYQLVYWINGREWSKYTLAAQQFWKLTNMGWNDVTSLRCMLQTEIIINYKTWTLANIERTLIFSSLICSAMLLQFFVYETKIIAYNPVRKLLNYVLDLVT